MMNFCFLLFWSLLHFWRDLLYECLNLVSIAFLFGVFGYAMNRLPNFLTNIAIIVFYQAMLKIIKHCKEFSPSLVTGQLLGLDVGSVLEVTNCFPFPVSGFHRLTLV